MGSRMRKNKSQRNQRRANLHANLPRTTVDTETGSVHLRHRVDIKTGMYRGRQVLEVANNIDSTEETKQDSKAQKSESKKSKSAEKAAA